MKLPSAFFRGKDLISSNIGKRLFAGSFWLVLGAVGGRGLVLISFIFVAHIIGKNEYGELSIIRSTINMFIAIASMGFGFTASKYIAQYRHTNREKATEIYVMYRTISYIMAFFLALILILFAPVVASKSLNNLSLTLSVRIGALVLLFSTINSVQSGVLSGLEEFKELSKNTFFSGIVQAVFIVICSIYWKVNGAIIGLGVGCFVLLVFNAFSIKKKFSGNFCKFRNIRKDVYKILWTFSLPSFFSSFLVIPVLWWAKTFLIAKSGYSEMANFDVADQWSMIALYLPSTLSQVLLPLLSNVKEEGTTGQFKKIIKVNLSFNVTITFIISLVLIILSKYILKLYGSDFNDFSSLIYMLFASVIISACGVVGQVIASLDKMWIGFIFNLIWGVWMILFAYLFVAKGRASGLALAILLAYSLHFISQMVYLYIKVKKIDS